MADASNGGSDCEIKPQATTLFVSVDYDTLSGQLKTPGSLTVRPSM